jgi:peptidoglycan/LPS O-acetylase OafA/YrhL
LSKVIVPFIVSILLCQTLFYVDGRQLDIATVLKHLLRGNPDILLPFSWFPFAIIYFYVCFYIVYRYLTDDIEYGLFYLLFATILYMCTTKFLLGWTDRWWVSTFAFNAGLLWKYNENAILTFLQKKRYALFSSILLPLVFLVGWRGTASAPLYPMCILIIFSLINIPNIKLFSYLGAISYEIYLLQGIPMILLRGNHIHIQSDYVFILLTLIITIVLAAILHYSITYFQNLLRPQKKGQC